MSARLVDQDARDRVREDLDATLIVEAAAGTGKTTALVERVLALLRTGRATLASLVAVTFTEKAAGEMKLRLRTEIERARAKATDETERERLYTALLQLEAAHIGTIHAFCADLLREHPVEAKIDPLFEVASEEDALRLYEEAFATWFQRTLTAPGEGAARVLRRATRARDQDGPRRALEKAGFALVAQRDFDAPYAPCPFDRRGAFDAVLDELAKLAAHARLGFAESWLTKGLVEIDRALGDIARLDAHRTREVDGTRTPDADHYDAVEARLRTLARHKCWGWKGSGTWFNQPEGITRQFVLDERERAKASLDRLLATADAELAALLFRELHAGGHDGEASLVAMYEGHKAKTGKLDFLDLLLLTRDLIVRDESVRRELQARFSHLLVDEFQDTDPLQAEILLVLAGRDPSVANAEAAQILPGKLFVVGDPKQSIYRFRRADVSLYEAIKERLVAGGASVVHLRTSFRSAPSIQEFVNAAFEPLMMPNASRSQATYVSLAAHRADPEGRPAIVALPIPRPYTDYGRIGSWKIEESFPDAVGAFIDWLLHHSGWTVSERGTDAPVKVEARHVCLLFKRFQSFATDCTRPYVRALEVRRIPHVLVGGRSFYDREEVLAVRTALTCIEWPDDALSTYATLRGPFFALGDDALLAFKHTQGHVHYLRKRSASALTELTRPVALALEVLAELHARRNHRPIPETLTRFLEATRAHAGIAIWPSGEQALGNVLRVLDMARRFERASSASLRAFIVRLEQDAARGNANEAPMVEEGADGVRMMTVHKAKGLEFPVVILVDPTANMTFREPTRYVDTKRKLWAMPLCGAVPKELLDHREEVLAEDREEAIRLLYVATTRARDLLVCPVLGDERQDATDGWLEPLGPVLYPKVRGRSPKARAEGCPTFGTDTVRERPEGVRRSGPAMKPGLHEPLAGRHDVVFWDPHVLELDRDDDAGLRQQRILAVDDQGIVARGGIERHAAWEQARTATLGAGAKASAVVKTVTEVASSGGGARRRRHDASIEETSAARGARPHGKRFGTLVHAMLATVRLDADAAELADVARLQARLVGAQTEEIEAARDATAAALAHPIFARARRAVRVERETPVMLEQADGTIVEGVVDLAFLEPNEGAAPTWTVVDFKTDVELSFNRDAYLDQVDAYADAIAVATGHTARAVVLCV